MSVHEASSAPCRPLTAVAWTSSGSTCPRDFTLISTTHDGATANFNPTGGSVVSDIQLISEKDPMPHGYCYIPEYLEPKTSVFKKKRVCVRLVPLGSVEMAVLDIRVTAKSKVVLQHYTCLGDIHGYVLWSKKGPFSSPTPQAKPRSITLDIRQMSLDEPPPPLPLRPSNGPPAPPVGKLSHRRSNLETRDLSENLYDSSNINSVSAMDGVPFTLHPKFEAQPKGHVPEDSLKDIRIKSVQEIENEYNYTFLVEESAASRTRHRASLSAQSSNSTA
ncbi:multivesicular body subunit 12A isoform X2 [Scleropages formosus]|uniref:multivesicular body subunit 12A isoform X2 n=1 Tax=Scleropages formosus TaxID=113540 RepID=UPI000877EC5A|nr:multivesicular body subunit 12A isoform X2 [Scleropages formosus]